MRKLKNLVLLILKCKFIFSDPKKTKIVILDPVYSYEVVRTLRQFKPFLLNNRIEQINEIYLSSSIIFFLIKNFFKYSLKLNYLLALIKISDPKILITRIDTSNDFHILSKILYKKVVCISLQQGLRALPNKNLKVTDTDKNDFQKYFIPEFFVFSHSDKYFFRNLKTKVKNYHIIGSIRARAALNYFKLRNINTSISYDFCLISSPGKYSTTGYIAQYLHDFCKEKNFSYVIAADTDLKDGNELQFYREFMGDRKINIVKNFHRKYTSYRIILKSKVIVGQFSTLLKESLSYNKKILEINGIINNFANKDLFIYKKNNIKNVWQPKINSYSKFMNFASDIYEMSNIDYSKKFKNRDYVMKRDQDSINLLKKKILYFLKKQNVENI